MAKTKNPILPQEVMRSVQIDFSPEEINKMAKQMSNVLTDIECIKLDAKEKASMYKNQQQAKEAEIANLRNHINLGYQMISKSCKLVRNYEKQVREYWFNDKLVETEPLTKDDYQQELDFCEEQNNPESTDVKKLDGPTADSADPKNDIEDYKPTKEQIAQSNDFVKAGDAEYELKRYREALEFYDAAVKINPKNEKAVNKQVKTKNWVDALIQQGAIMPDPKAEN